MTSQGTGDESSAYLVNMQKWAATKTTVLQEFLTQPTNKDQLCKKYALYQRKESLSEEEEERLQTVFNHFAVEDRGNKRWTESSFTSFLAFVLPITTTWRLGATPMMYRLFRQLGSYPYHTQPTSDTLTFDQMVMAIQILHRRLASFKACHDKGERVIKRATPMKDMEFCRLLFQSLTASGTIKSDPDPRLFPDDDEDLLDVRRALCMFSERGIINPDSRGEMIYGAGVPEIYHFPSSLSNDLSGRLLVSELTVVFRLLVANRPGNPVDHDVDAEADSIVMYFVESEFQKQESLSDGKIGWNTFSHVLTGKNYLLTHYFPAFKRIFSPCLKKDWVITMKWLDSLPFKRERSP